MKFFTVAASLLLAVSAVALGAEGAWQPLFTGENLDQWQVKCKPGDAGKHFWKIDNGTILADSIGQKGHDYIWLCTRKEYGDFDLRLKFQVYRDSPGNSGVQIRSRYDDAAGWLDGPQIDINPPGPWRTGMVWDETRGVQRWIYPNLPKGKWVDESMAARGIRFYFSSDEPAWNEMEISARGMAIKATLNGVVVTDFRGEGILDDDVHKQRNVGTSGVIALQIHAGDQLRIRYKDIDVREAAR